MSAVLNMKDAYDVPEQFADYRKTAFGRAGNPELAQITEELERTPPGGDRNLLKGKFVRRMLQTGMFPIPRGARPHLTLTLD